MSAIYTAWHCDRCGCWHVYWHATAVKRCTHRRHPTLSYASEVEAVAAKEAELAARDKTCEKQLVKELKPHPSPAYTEPGGKKRRVMRKGSIYGG